MANHASHRPNDPDTAVGGWTVSHYAQIVKWPAVMTIVLNIIATTADWNLAFMWLFLIILTVYLGIAAHKLYHGSLMNATGLGFAAGLIVGVFTSLYQFLWFHTVTAFFQMITTSLLSLLLSVLMSASAYLAFSEEKHRREKKPSLKR